MAYAIKIRDKEKASRSWWFLTPKGYGNRLRIHAAQIEDKGKADRLATEIQTANTHLDAKVVTL